MASTSTDRGHPRVDVLPLVQGISHGDNLVFLRVGINMANERRFEVIMQVRVGDSDLGAATSDIKEAIIVVLVVVAVRREVKVIEPNLGGLLNCESITGGSEDLGDLDVANDYIGLPKDAEANTGEGSARLAEDGRVRADSDDSVAGDRPRYYNDLSIIASNCGGKFLEGRDGNGCTTDAPSGPVVYIG